MRSGTFAHCSGVRIACARCSTARAIARPFASCGRITANMRTGENVRRASHLRARAHGGDEREEEHRNAADEARERHLRQLRWRTERAIGGEHDS